MFLGHNASSLRSQLFTNCGLCLHDVLEVSVGYWAEAFLCELIDYMYVHMPYGYRPSMHVWVRGVFHRELDVKCLCPHRNELGVFK